MTKQRLCLNSYEFGRWHINESIWQVIVIVDDTVQKRCYIEFEFQGGVSLIVNKEILLAVLSLSCELFDMVMRWESIGSTYLKADSLMSLTWLDRVESKLYLIAMIAPTLCFPEM